MPTSPSGGANNTLLPCDTYQLAFVRSVVQSEGKALASAKNRTLTMASRFPFAWQHAASQAPAMPVNMDPSHDDDQQDCHLRFQIAFANTAQRISSTWDAIIRAGIDELRNSSNPVVLVSVDVLISRLSDHRKRLAEQPDSTSMYRVASNLITLDIYENLPKISFHRVNTDPSVELNTAVASYAAVPAVMFKTSSTAFSSNRFRTICSVCNRFSRIQIAQQICSCGCHTCCESCLQSPAMPEIVKSKWRCSEINAAMQDSVDRLRSHPSFPFVHAFVKTTQGVATVPIGAKDALAHCARLPTSLNAVCAGVTNRDFEFQDEVTAMAMRLATRCPALLGRKLMSAPPDTPCPSCPRRRIMKKQKQASGTEEPAVSVLVRDLVSFI